MADTGRMNSLQIINTKLKISRNTQKKWWKTSLEKLR